ncbi:MAG: DUF2752 domain-containing protein [Eubacterium sp.]|nr:DUF2752 domain-containing protein [Eubacterium sp.]
MKKMSTEARVFYIISIIILVGFGAIVIMQNVGGIVLTDAPFECGFLAATGFFCPGCGGTHAVIELARGHLFRSFVDHPFVIYCVACALVDFIIYTVCLIRKKGFPKFRMIFVYIGVAVLLVQWIAKNVLVRVFA